MDATLPSTSTPRVARWQRPLGITLGFANQLLFLVTVWYLFWFLRDGTIVAGHQHWLLRDCALAIVFAVAHSVMLAPSVRKRLTQWVPRAFYDSLFCAVTCVSLLALFWGWRVSERVLWDFHGPWLMAIRICFYASWLALFYSLALTGLGYQNGWTPFYYWLIQ